MEKLTAVALVAFCALMAAAAQLLFKLGSKGIGVSLLSWLNWKLILGMTLYAIASILLIIALKYQNLSILYPVVATSYIWVTILSTWFLHETFPAIKWLGIALIITGILIIVR